MISNINSQNPVSEVIAPLIEAPKPTPPLPKNFKMVASIVSGVVIAIFFTGVILASILATHGVAIPVFTFIAYKLTSISAVGSAVGSKLLYSVILTGIVNIAGALAGKLYRSGESEAKESFLLENIFFGINRTHLITDLSRKEIDEYRIKKEGTIFLCQSGRNFRKLDVTKDWMCGQGIINKIKSIFVFIAYMFILDPYESFKSLIKFKKYFIYKNLVKEEEQLKAQINPQNIEKLDQLYQTRIEELILSKSSPTYNLYLLRPELSILDRYIAASEATIDLNPSMEDERKLLIYGRIQLLKNKKIEIATQLFEAEGFRSIEDPSGRKFRAMHFFELNKKINEIEISAERKMQIREAVSILVSHPNMTIDDINRAVNQLINGLIECQLDESDQWKSRESCIRYAINQYNTKSAHKDMRIALKGLFTPTYLTDATKAPMSVDKTTLAGKIARSILTDLAVCLIPAAPIAAFIWTILTINFAKHVSHLNTRPQYYAKKIV